MAGLEDLTEQDATLALGKGFSERIETAGVSDIRTVHTLNTHTHKSCLLIYDDKIQSLNHS